MGGNRWRKKACCLGVLTIFKHAPYQQKEKVSRLLAPDGSRFYTASSNPCQVYSRSWIMAQVYPKASHSAQVR